ncbi:MAG: efflux RND transporter periplasmic adaptor subunit [Proteobacteria bacterium]|nr:efflux RND transporter periplasmic adaptor subunit [Pseudomonadota bacterium]
MRSVVAIFVVIVAATAIGGSYWYVMVRPQQIAAAQGAGRGGTPAGFAMPVEAEKVRIAPSERSVVAIGTLRSNESVVVRPEVAGRIAQINFAEGQPIRKGQVLVQLDSSVERAELAQAKASLALAQANHERADELVKRGAGTARALDEARWKLQNDDAAVKLAEAKLTKLSLAAPFDGVIGLRRLSVGEYVSPGTDIGHLEQIDTLKVDFRVPEIFLPAIRAGQKITVNVDALPDRGFDGEVFAIDPLIDAAGRSIVIRARIANADAMLRPGLFARVRLTLEARQDAVFVPEQSLVPIGDQQFVFKVVDGKTAFTKVKLGIRRKGEAEVLEGLAAGDVVITGGLLKVRDGMPVQVVPAAPPPPAKTSTPNVAENAKRG